ncbi:MAG: hypothetical protein ACI94Y_001633 [Maribacter sp.]|jgi:hypothetical protein
MAKRKKPVSIFNLPKEEVMKASSEIIINTQKEPTGPSREEKPKLEPKPKPAEKKPPMARKKPIKTKKKVTLDPSGRRKFLYVDEVHHQQAKINAAMKGMKLQDYIAWLIEGDVG